MPDLLLATLTGRVAAIAALSLIAGIVLVWGMLVLLKMVRPSTQRGARPSHAAPDPWAEAARRAPTPDPEDLGA